MAKVIEAANRPALVMAHNKTLAAQLYHESRTSSHRMLWNISFSYYDYYPARSLRAARISTSKKSRPSTTNWTIEALGDRGRCLSGGICLIVASVSCIYGLGSPEAYYGMLLSWKRTKDQARRHHKEAG